MIASKESLALDVLIPKAEGEFEFTPLNFQSKLTEVDVILLYGQFLIPLEF